MAKIDRFPNYEFHEDGFVISYMKKQPKVLTPIKMGEYKGFSLVRNDNLVERIYLHRAICEAFSGPCPDGWQCRHLNGDKDDNRAANLKWGTKQENENDRKKHKTTAVGESNPMAKLTADKVKEMRLFRSKTGLSYKKIGKAFGVSTMTAFRAVTHRSWNHD